MHNMPDRRSMSFVTGCVLGAALSLIIYAEPFAGSGLLADCSPGAPPVVLAHAAYVYDLTTDTSLYEKEAQAQLPLASLTKVMTVLTAGESLPKDATITLTRDALSTEGESGFRAGDRLSIDDLAAFTLIESSNDGATALALAAAHSLGMNEGDFVALMNRRARGLGLTQTYFLNETGLDISTSSAGAFGSARDVAVLMARLATQSPTVIERSVAPVWAIESLEGRTYTAKNTALLATAFGAAIGSKTGYTDLAGGNIAFVFEPMPGMPVAVAVLGSTREEREVDASKLARYAHESLRRALVCTNHD